MALSIAGLARSQTASADLNAPLEIVEMSAGDTLRGLAEQYLRDPDLWPAVMEINEIASPAELVPGVKLRLPVRQVRAADRALLVSLEAIQKATAEGARIFAPFEIGEAIDNRDSAVSSRAGGAWRQAVSFSGIATEFANEALDISVQQRDRAAEAIVSDIQGRVEGRAPVETRWSNRNIGDVLVEFEQMRTLSASTTQITFRDLSRLRLNPNSNATIQRMRSDPLTGTEVTKVSLVEGDFYALLNQLSEKVQFEIDVPGVETTTNSADFWIKNDRTGARFVNYDAADLNLVSGDETIAVGENEGVVLTRQGAQRTRVLTAQHLTSPDINQIIYGDTTDLAWAPFDGAQGYWLEIARDHGFNEMQVSEWGLTDTAFAATLPPDRYHWRVAALDQLGLPGEWSVARDFSVKEDTTPPFLALLQPADGVLTDQPSIDVLGATEADVAIELAGRALDLASDGTFLATVPLVFGNNAIEVTARDAAGNISTRTTNVVYRPNVSVDIALSDLIPRVGDALATRSDSLSVVAQTNAQPGANVVVRDHTLASDALSTTVGASGEVTFTVPAASIPRGYTIEILAPDGTVEGSLSFQSLRDQTPPDLSLDFPLPRVTPDASVDVSGTVADAVKLALNGRDLVLLQGRFAVEHPLQPGANTLELVASDAVGNISVLNLKTVQDIAPPNILSVELGRPTGRSGSIELLVQAEDDSGLVQAAPYVLSVGGVEREGFLRCDPSGICLARLPAEPGRLQLIELTIEDYAGNAAYR